MEDQSAVKRRVIRGTAIVGVVFLAVNAVGLYLLAVKDEYVGSLICTASVLIGLGHYLWVRRQPPPYGSG
jgi:hypothetical protein